jgi:hypothetical protein
VTLFLGAVSCGSDACKFNTFSEGTLATMENIEIDKTSWISRQRIDVGYEELIGVVIIADGGGIASISRSGSCIPATVSCPTSSSLSPLVGRWAGRRCVRVRTRDAWDA